MYDDYLSHPEDIHRPLLDQVRSKGVDLEAYDSHIWLWPTSLTDKNRCPNTPLGQGSVCDGACRGTKFFTWVYGPENFKDNRVVLHEVGHNWGLSHGSKDGMQFGGQSGPMGNAAPVLTCYNTPQQLQLQWSTSTTLNEADLPFDQYIQLTIVATTVGQASAIEIPITWILLDNEPTTNGIPKSLVIGYRVKKGNDAGLLDEFVGKALVYQDRSENNHWTIFLGSAELGGKPYVHPTALVQVRLDAKQSGDDEAVISICRMSSAASTCAEPQGGDGSTITLSPPQEPQPDPSPSPLPPIEVDPPVSSGFGPVTCLVTLYGDGGYSGPHLSYPQIALDVNQEACFYTADDVLDVDGKGLSFDNAISSYWLKCECGNVDDDCAAATGNVALLLFEHPKWYASGGGYMSLYPNACQGTTCQSYGDMPAEWNDRVSAMSLCNVVA